MRDFRGGTDGVVFWDEPLACERIENGAVGLEDAASRIDDFAGHCERVGHVEPEDVQLLAEFVGQSFAQSRFVVEEAIVGVGVEEGLQSLLWLNVEEVVGIGHDEADERVVQLDEAFLADWWGRDGVVVVDDIVEAYDLVEVPRE